MGTGSLKLAEWRTNEYIKLEKFADYCPPDAPWSGFAGDKTVSFETATFYFINDDSTRVAAALTGEYDLVSNINYDNLGEFEGADNVALTEGEYSLGGLIFIKKEGSGSYAEDPKFRLAVSTALDIDEIVAAQVPDKNYYTLESQYMAPFQKAWSTDVGDAYYNVKDIEKAKAYLAESSYDGGDVVMVTTQEYPHMYNGTLVIQKQLEAIGIKVKVDVMDWATMLTRINEPETLDMFVSAFGISPIPGTLLFLSPVRTGFTNNSELNDIFTQMNAAATMEEAQNLWIKGPEIAYQSAEYVPLGHRYYVVATSDKVKNYKSFLGVTIWGMEVTE